MQVYSQYLWNIVFSRGKIWVFAGARGQMNTTLCQNRPEETQNWTNLYLKPHDCRIYYANINLRHQYGISAAESQTFLRAKRLQRRRARRNGCFRRLLFLLFLPYFLLNLFTWQEKFLLFLRFLRNSRTSRSPSWPFLFVSVEFVKFVLLAIFAIFVAQSFHVARKILVTFAIFAKFAISSILLW